MAKLTKKMLEDELVQLLKKINEEVVIDDVYGADYYYSDGKSAGAFCKIVIKDWRVYIWENGKTYYPINTINIDNQEYIDSWILCRISRITLTESSTCPSGN